MLTLKQALEKTEQEYIIQTLICCKGSLSAAAVLLGLKYHGLYSRLRKYKNLYKQYQFNQQDPSCGSKLFGKRPEVSRIIPRLAQDRASSSVAALVARSRSQVRKLPQGQ